MPRSPKAPDCPFDYQVNSTRHFMRELNRLGVTGVIDAGGGFQNYPEDYAVIQKLADDGQMTVRFAYNLFTQKPKQEKEDFLNWTKTSRRRRRWQRATWRLTQTQQSRPPLKALKSWRSLRGCETLSKSVDWHRVRKKSFPLFYVCFRRRVSHLPWG
jgi:hypothetical protein